MKFYHGTDLASGLEIMKNGFHPQNQVFNCSDEEMVYMAGENMNYWDNESTQFEELQAVEFAVEAAQIASADKNSMERDVIVFEIEMDESLVEPDDSCDGMSDCYQIEATALNQYLLNGKAKLKAFRFYRQYEGRQHFNETVLRVLIPAL